MKLVFLITAILFLTKYAFIYLADSLIFHPKKYPDGIWDLSSVPWPITDHWVNTSDNIRLHARHFEKPESETVILWLHGNGGNIVGRTQNALTFVQNLPVSVFLLSYRGYGKSEGKPKEQGLYIDVISAYEYLHEMKNIKNIIVYGASLGGAVGIDLATKVNLCGLIIEAGFTSIEEVGKIHYPYLPCKLIAGKQFNSISKIENVNCPKLFIYGDQDDVVPFDHGKKLFKKAKNPKNFYHVKGANHNDLLEIGGHEYLNQVKNFLEKVHPNH